MPSSVARKEWQLCLISSNPKEVSAAPSAVWRLWSDPNRLAEWVATTTASHRAGEDAVQLQGESHGHDYDTHGGCVADAAAKRLSWDSPRHSGYRGALRGGRDHADGSPVTDG